MTLNANQKCLRLGITPSFGLVIGYPSETSDDISMTIDLANQLKCEAPDAQLFFWVEKHGLVARSSLYGWCNCFFDDYDFIGEKPPGTAHVIAI